MLITYTSGELILSIESMTLFTFFFEVFDTKAFINTCDYYILRSCYSSPRYAVDMI